MGSTEHENPSFRIPSVTGAAVQEPVLPARLHLPCRRVRMRTSAAPCPLGLAPRTALTWARLLPPQPREEQFMLAPACGLAELV